jgi:integrase
MFRPWRKCDCFGPVLAYSALYELLSTLAGARDQMRVKISLREIAAMQPHSILWDSKLAGFCARRQFSDVITYSVYFRTREGQQRLYKIGRHGVFTPQKARDEATHVLRNVAVGKDPGAELKASRRGPTISELCDEYQKHPNGKKASTLLSDASRIVTHIKPRLGKMKVASVTSDVVETFMHSLSAGSAKRVTGLLGSIFSFAVKKGMRETNPVHGVEKPADVKRMRRLGNDEYEQLWSALKREKNVATDIFLFLAVTGFRSGEAKNLQWKEVDLDRQTVILGDTKTGVSVRPLSGAAIEIIKRQKQSGAPYVFAHHHNRPINGLRPWWVKLGLDKTISPHVLRHSFASLGADLGLSDNTISSLLGHKGRSITSRYLHGSDKALIAAADSVAVETLRLMRC